MDSTTLEIRFLSPEEMVDFFALLKKCIRSDEKPDFESGSLRPNGNGTKFSCRQMVVKSKVVCTQQAESTTKSVCFSCTTFYKSYWNSQTFDKLGVMEVPVILNVAFQGHVSGGYWAQQCSRVILHHS